MPTSGSPLQELRDVHLPDTISLWPPAPGWWITFGVVMMGGMVFLWILRNRRRTQARRLAIKELGAIKQYYDTHRDDQWLVQRLSTIVRRYAMATFPRTEVAGLVGVSWLQFLDRSGRTNQFTDGVGHLLSSGPYQQQAVVSATELMQLVEHWIQQVTPPQKEGEDMMTLAWPWALAFVLFPWMVRRWASPVSNSSGRAMKVPHFEDIMSVQSNQLMGVTRSRRSTLFWVGIFIWSALLLAAARPQWSGDPVGLPTSGRDLMLAVDISGSMKIPDFSVNGQEVTRLEVVKAAAGEFIARRTGDRVGLIVFGSQAYVQTPLTFDRDTVKAMMTETEIGLAGQETAIGDAIGLAVKRLKKQSAGSRVLVLLTDGANTAGEVSPTQAAALAEEQGIRIYAIGVGADRMEIASFFGTQTVNPSRDLDEDTLRHLAQRTGGLYLRAKDTEGLRKVYEELDRLEPATTETELFRPTTELYMWPLGFALALSCVMAMSFIWKRERVLKPRWKAEGIPARAGR